MRAFVRATRADYTNAFDALCGCEHRAWTLIDGLGAQRLEELVDSHFAEKGFGQPDGAIISVVVSLLTYRFLKSSRKSTRLARR